MRTSRNGHLYEEQLHQFQAVRATHNMELNQNPQKIKQNGYIPPSWLWLLKPDLLIHLPWDLNREGRRVRNSLCSQISKGTTLFPKCGRWGGHSNQEALQTTQLFPMAPLGFNMVYTCTFQKGTSESPALALEFNCGWKGTCQTGVRFQKKHKQSFERFG